MKIRIRGDSIRLRLSQTEVSEIAKQGFVQDETRFPGGAKFVYRLETNPQGKEILARYVDQQMVVSIPLSQALAWASSDEVALKANQLIDPKVAEPLFILIEKDFQCLKVRDNEIEDEADLFINPNADSGRCG